MPSERPNFASKSRGQVRTIRSIAGSRSNVTRSATASPATFRSASTISRTVTEMPGTLIVRDAPNALAGASCAITRLATTVRGDTSQMRVDASTGQLASTPASGSRMMPLANEDAALFGLPGRTLTVGSRRLRPSRKPLRV